MNPYLKIVRGSVNKADQQKLDALVANRNVLLAQGKMQEALVLDVEINRLKKKLGGKTKAACFPGSTLILTPKGYTKISTLKKGDIIVSYSHGERVTSKVKSRLMYPAATIRDYHLENGNVFTATAHHTILTNKGWEKLEDLSTGSTILYSDLEKTKPIKIVKIDNERKEVVYNLHTIGNHNFIVKGGIIAHNYTFLRRIRTALASLRDLFCEEEQDYVLIKA